MINTHMESKDNLVDHILFVGTTYNYFDRESKKRLQSWESTNDEQLKKEKKTH